MPMDRTQNETSAKSGTVAAVERALSILDAFSTGDQSISLTELSRRVGLSKPTTLRLAKTMAQSGFLVRNADSTWRLGSKIGKLGGIYTSGFKLEEYILPTLQELRRVTGESATFYVREGDRRVCLFRAQSSQSISHVTRPGSSFPLDQGAPGRVMLAFAGQPGEPYETIRQRHYHVTRGERDPQVASMACPIFNVENKLIGTLAISGPTNRFTDEIIASYLEPLRRAASELNERLSGARGPATFD
ncbi:IclR family transcriptional regulator [Aureimonas altamirensis]|uniref:IclR family transcriptional regulator n=1 Tax=Aureimonas altamirensis TaxID=370622 RepID=UPI0025528F01|nr:IclR family transcriptional regulator [Aureimonas altamirensis]MCM2502828.1 IclR family transcriptional regulator [Aureimonas altamirensis]